MNLNKKKRKQLIVIKKNCKYTLYIYNLKSTTPEKSNKLT